MLLPETHNKVLMDRMKYAKQKEYYLHGLPEPQRTEIVGEEVNLYETNV